MFIHVSALRERPKVQHRFLSVLLNEPDLKEIALGLLVEDLEPIKQFLEKKG